MSGETGLYPALQRGDHPNTWEKQQPTVLSTPESHQGCRNPYVPSGMSHPEGNCRHKKMAWHQLEQATSSFSPRAPAPNAKHVCNPRWAELQRCAHSTRSCRGLCLAFMASPASRAPLPSASCCGKLP